MKRHISLSAKILLGVLCVFIVAIIVYIFTRYYGQLLYDNESGENIIYEMSDTENNSVIQDRVTSEDVVSEVFVGETEKESESNTENSLNDLEKVNNDVIDNTDNESDSLEDIPEEIVDLLTKNKELENYVYSYLEKKDKDYEIDLSKEANMDKVPLLLQWDERWGYKKYGTGLIGYTGCGPTCLSMVILYLSHDANYTPLFIANYADEHGYYVNGSGTSWELMYQCCEEFGITASEISPNEKVIKDYLNQNKPIICSVGVGDFTDKGHFIVIADYTDEGLIVNDPNSIEKSNKLWEFNSIKKQIKNLWVYSVAETNGD